MEEKPYQNIDLPRDNPLDVKEEIPETSVKKSLNPKTLLLIILGAVIFVLFLLILIFTQVRQQKPATTQVIPTSVPVSTNPVTNDSLIPSPYRDAFQKLEQSFSQDPDLPAPQIDTEIGQ